MSRALTAKQQRFVQEYLVDFNASGAARRAGYSERSAGSIGDENLRKPAIAQAISSAMERYAMGTEETLARLSAMARGEAPTKVVKVGAVERKEYDAHGALRDIAKANHVYEDAAPGATILILRDITELPAADIPEADWEPMEEAG